MDRWDKLNSFFKRTGGLVTFGLNALHGRQKIKKQWRGNWQSSNAHDFINYTISKGYEIDSWEFGNELCGTGVGASVDAELYAKDMIRLKSLIDQLYKDVHPKPLLLAPGGFYDKVWFEKFLDVSRPTTVNALTHHIYNLGPGSDHNLISKILNPEYLDKISYTFGNLTQTIQANGPWASAWIGESGGAYNSGGRNVSNTFVNSFWYVDQLGMAAKYKTKVYCRQTLIGGNYGLLDTNTFIPNPDYYSALLWHRLMGRGVLDVNSNGSPYLRSYAHCTKERAGVTLLVINLSNQTEFSVGVKSTTSISLHASAKAQHKKRSFLHGLKQTVSWVGSKASDAPLSREEYHLTPEDGNLQSRSTLLNGRPLQLSETGDIPSFSPVLQDVSSPVSIAPLSIKFIVFPNFIAPGCREV
nr:heparanase-like protein 2 isoform X1 [Ipomoea batatas]